MSYTINYTDPNVPNRQPLVVEDGGINSQTSLTFPGRNFQGYGQLIGENFLHLLENFAKNTAPADPIIGQLWYDTGTLASPPQPQLRVWDGTQWVEAGNIKKGFAQPRAENSVLGDLWVDTANQQLYMFTGSTWVLVGPEFSQGNKSGLKTEAIVDRDTNTEKFVLIFYVNDNPITIISKDKFVPKIAIPGFSIINQGITMSSQDFDLDGIVENKYWGTSEKAEALLVGNTVVPAANFLRSDAVSTTNFTLNVRSGGGIVVGPALEASFSASSTATVINSRTPGAAIFLSTTPQNGQTKNVLIVTSQLDNNGNAKVGINREPSEALDVSGNILTTGTIKTVDATDVNTLGTVASISTAGGVNINKSVRIGEDANILRSATLGPANYIGNPYTVLAAATGEKFNIGTDENRFNEIYSRTFLGTTFRAQTSLSNPQGNAEFFGTLIGSVSGSASRLATTSAFSLRGDVSSNVIPFNGSQPVPTRTIATIARNAAGIVTVTTTTNHDYITGYVATVNCTSNNTFNVTGAPITVTGLTTFTYSQSGLGLPTINPTAAAGSVTINPGGTFITILNESVIADKTELSNSLDSDTFLVYRASETPPLRKINKATLLSNVSTVPIGSILPFAGDIPPLGYLFCDGSEQSKNRYPRLFSVLGFKYKPQSQLLNPEFNFALPDLRGRFALGRENMDNGNTINITITATGAVMSAIPLPGATTATFVVNNSLTTNGPFQPGRTINVQGIVLTGDVIITTVVNNSPATNFTTITVLMPPQTNVFPVDVTNLTITQVGVLDAGGGTPVPSRVAGATSLGFVGGNSQQVLSVNQLPQHQHNLKDSAGNQYFALNSSTGAPPETEVSNGNIHFTTGAGHLLKNSGGVNITGQVNQPVNLMNPFQTINYIIFTGETS
jgi:microcystin-dependent protein